MTPLFYSDLTFPLNNSLMIYSRVHIKESLVLYRLSCGRKVETETGQPESNRWTRAPLRWRISLVSFSRDSVVRRRWKSCQMVRYDRPKTSGKLPAGENLVLEMTAKGNSLESMLDALCRVVSSASSARSVRYAKSAFDRPTNK